MKNNPDGCLRMCRVLKGDEESAFPSEIFVLPSSFHEQDGERLQDDASKLVFQSGWVFSKVLGEALQKVHSFSCVVCIAEIANVNEFRYKSP